MSSILIAGASGLSGKALLQLLVKKAPNDILYTLERRASIAVSSNHRPIVVDFLALPALPAIDTVYCCLGTTIKKAGSKQAFREVDFTMVVNLARAAKAVGARQFLVMSALDASTQSAVFYSRVKGEMEEAIAAIGFDALHIFQPSFLLGERQESRLSERIGIAAFKTISPLLVAGIRKYRPIHVDVVAQAMLSAAASGECSLKLNVMRYTSDVIQAMGHDTA